MSAAAAALLGADGPFAQRDAAFVPRTAQQAMAEAVEQALREQTALIVEAGTGTGKTYAYLVPALLSRRRVIISTGTKTLQDQLYFRDLPRVREALGQPVRVALLKGRSNYLCRYRLRQAQADLRAWKQADVLHEIGRWADTSERGDLSEYGDLGHHAGLQPRITSTTDNCLGSRCPDFNECFVVRARRAAMAADLTVVNHHLLLADFRLKQTGFGEVLPGADAVIVDEAHHLADLATQFFGTRVSTGQLAELVVDVRSEAKALEDPDELLQAAEALLQATLALELAAQTVLQRMTTAEWQMRPGVPGIVGALGEALDALAEWLAAHAGRTPGLETCSQRAAQLVQHWREVANLAAADAADAADADESANAAEEVRWIEPLTRGCALHATPIRVAPQFRKMMARAAGAWVFTSATLSAGDDFANFRADLGLDSAATLRLDSPFDYRRQARLYLPSGLPEPNSADYGDAVAEAIVPILQASRGGAFVLCTSHRAVQQLAMRLRAVADARWAPLLVQGEADKASLLARFAAAGDAVLVGTASFWEGVDVRGDALRVVIIDRLPFAAPGDPVQEARLEAIRARGGNPFVQAQLPQAITALRQGVGRLLRDVSDRGLLMLCDPRVQHKGYGRRVLASLPPAPRLSRRSDAVAWLESTFGTAPLETDALP